MVLNVMVVEDEEYVRKSIVYKIDWQRFGLNLAGEAANGIEALEIARKQNIDIVITDIKMPGMDGLELIENMKAEFEHTRFIIVSGYSEFEYAKRALAYNVSEYILKPVKGAHLEKVLKTIREEIMEERIDALYRSNIEKSFEENAELIKNYYFIKLLQGEDDAEYTKMYIEKLSEFFPHDQFEVSLLRVLPTPIEGDNNAVAADSFDAIIECLREVYDAPYIKVFNNLRYNSEWIIVNNFAAGGYSDISTMHTRVIGNINKKSGVNCIIGVGTAIQGMENIGTSFKNAEYAVKEAIIQGQNKIIKYAPFDNAGVKENLLTENECVIQSYLESGSTTALKEYMQRMFRHLLRSGKKINHQTCFDLALDLFVTLKKYLQRNSNDAVSGSELDPEFVSDLMKCTTIEGVIRWCDACINWFENMMASNLNNSGKELVASIRKYITANYGSDISLDSIAGKFNISPNYLSRIFKVYTSESFKAFLTKIRMEKAIDLIMNSELKLYNISEIIGYEDSKYFSKVFKSYFGFPPSRFKENIDRTIE